MNRGLSALACKVAIWALATSAVCGELETGNIPTPRIFEPTQEIRAAVFLLSDAGGWGAADDAAATSLAESGAVVVGIDLPGYLDHLEGEDRTCAYTVSAIESLSRQLQRRAGLKAYHLPIIAGKGAGGAMALAIAAQTPVATVGATLALDPQAAIALRKPLCTPAAKMNTGSGMAYQLKTGILPNAITVLQSRAQSAEGRAHVAGLKRSHPEIAVEEADGAGTEVLAAALNKQIEANETAIASLPLTEVGAAAKHDLMAIIISGDGGWRDIDRKVAGFLAEDGVPTIGLDALRYFWSERTPEETARDLERIMDSYGPSFGAGKVVLAGYSFGANVLTLAYARLRPEYQERVTLVSLIAPSVKADFEIAVTGWLGADGAGKAGSVADHVRATHSAKVQCIYGLAEKESACMALSGSSVEVIGLPGGHHFDGDYRDLTVQVFRSAIRRTKAESSAESD